MIYGYSLIMEPASFIYYHGKADEVDSKVTLSTGTVIDVFHFAEFGEYMRQQKDLPLFRKPIEKYYEEKFGSEWETILAFQDQLHHKFIADVEGSFRWENFDPNYKFRFVGKENELYVYEFNAYCDDVNDPGGSEYRLKVNPVISIDFKESIG